MEVERIKASVLVGHYARIYIMQQLLERKHGPKGTGTEKYISKVLVHICCVQHPYLIQYADSKVVHNVHSNSGTALHCPCQSHCTSW